MPTTALDGDLAAGLGTAAAIVGLIVYAAVDAYVAAPEAVARRVTRNRRFVRWLLGWPPPPPAGHWRIRLTPGVRLVDVDPLHRGTAAIDSLIRDGIIRTVPVRDVTPILVPFRAGTNGLGR